MTNGTVVTDLHESRVLKGNPLGDPHVRRLPVYLPPSYLQSRRRFPVIWVLAGFTGSGKMHLNRRPWGETFAERVDRLIRTRKMKEAILVFPDCFTTLGGSQYLNSSAVGRYEDYVVRELVPFVDRRYRTKPGPASRAVMGKSSGGYGSIVLAMRHPDVFGLVACQSGDMLFEYCYFPDIPKFLTSLPKYGGSTKSFLRRFRKAPDKMKHEMLLMMNLVAMSACYAPRTDGGYDLPFDTSTGAYRPEVFERWLEHDPYRMVNSHGEALSSLRALFIDVGNRDEFHLQLGARLLRDRLGELGVNCTYEEFDGGHFSTSYRYESSIPFLIRALSNP